MPQTWSARARILTRVMLATTLWLAPTRTEASERLTLTATAGIGGIVKPGRWTPLQIDIENADNDVSAEIVVSWGDARLRREVALPSPGKRRFELYLRTSDVEGIVRVRLVSQGPDILVDAPVKVLPQDERVTLCVTRTDTLVPAAGSCTASIAPDRLPGSPRGYDAVDHVTSEGAERAASGEQRIALDRWRAIRGLENSGDLALTSQVARPMLRRSLPRATAQAVAGLATTYLVALLLVGLALAVRRARLSSVTFALAVVLFMGTAAAFAIGRVGPARTIQVHHASLLQQLPGTTGSLLTMRGVMEFPAHDTFRVRLALQDAMIEATAASGRSEQMVNDEGFPILQGPFGLGTRRAFASEAITEAQPLTVTVDGRRIHVTNASDSELRDCRFAAGFSLGAVGVLTPGSSIDADQSADVVGPIFTCTFSEPPVAFVDSVRPVATPGSTVVAVYRDPLANRPEALAARHD